MDRKRPTFADVNRVDELRKLGHTYAEIDEAMGWEEAEGARAWRIINDAEYRAAALTHRGEGH